MLFLPQTFAVFQWRHVEMLSHILAKERCVGETENARNLLDGLRGGTEEISDVGKRVFRNPL